jgi:CheY-like chemotaxis protein
MARVLISEPHADNDALLRRAVERLGHEIVDDRDVEQVDVAVIEPAEPEGVRLARRLRERAVPFLFTSVHPPAPEDLALAPVAYLVKPFPLSAVEQVLEYALAAPSTAR